MCLMQGEAKQTKTLGFGTEKCLLQSHSRRQVAHDLNIPKLSEKLKLKLKSLSRVRFFATPWTVAYHDPLPRSSVHGIFQVRVLEWVAISFSRGSSKTWDRTWVSGVVGRRFTI